MSNEIQALKNEKTNTIAKKKVTTPKFRVSFPTVFSPKSFEGQEPKYSVVMLFEKSTDLKAMKQAAQYALVEKWGADQKKWPRNLKTPFRDGADRADTEGYDGMIFVTASSKKQPGLVDNRLQPILSEDDFYPGCYARATLIAFAYDKAGNKGVSFSLQNIQKLADGESLSGRRKAEQDFEAVETEADSAFGETGGEDTPDIFG